MKAVEFINISKSFGNFPANKDISFSIKKNSVHCILGENGAGKSTLMKILFGIYKPDSGTLKIFDNEVRFNSPHDAIEKKIGMVHQHFMLIDDFTVLENVILGDELTKGLKIDFKDTRKILNEIINKYNLDLDVDKKISDISISKQQKVEILKILFRDSEILIFDEPTAVLSPMEVDEFFKITDEFKRNGKTIIIITHKLNEVKQISDRVSVLRKGELVYEENNENGKLDLEKLSNAIVGGVVFSNSINKEYKVIKALKALRMKNISIKRNNVECLNGLNLELEGGEIHGICGVEGNGQNEIIDIITGLEKNFEGTYITESKNISLVPDDRIKKGMIKEYSIGENIILKNGKRNFIFAEYLKNISNKVIEEYDVRVSDSSADLGSLSGGNQQKVIVAREIGFESEILIFSHPTRGVDINSTLFIHSKIIEQRNLGKSILLISSDLDELITLSDKLSILYNGRIIKTFEEPELKSFKQDNLHLEIESSSNSQLYNEIGKLMIGLTG